MKYPYIVP